MRPEFGPAGHPVNYWNSEYKKDTALAPYWVKSVGLDTYEFQCTHGVRTPKHKAEKIRDNCKEAGITISIHAPYYIQLTSLKKDVIERSKQRLLRAVKLAEIEDVKKIIFHPGYYHENPKLALQKCAEGLMEVIEKTKDSKVCIYPESGGKVKSVGSLDDLIMLAKLHKRIKPCVDFAHHHARTGGELKSKRSFEKIFEEIEKELGKNAAERLHCHFSSLEFTTKGEKNHVPYNMKGMGPDHKHCVEAIVENNWYPTMICESTDTQDMKALQMKKYYEKLTK